MAKMKKLCMLAAVVAAEFFACDAQANWNGRVVITNDLEESHYIGNSANAVIWQTNYTVNVTSGGYLGYNSNMAAYLLDGGSLTFDTRWAYGA